VVQQTANSYEPSQYAKRSPVSDPLQVFDTHGLLYKRFLTTNALHLATNATQSNSVRQETTFTKTDLPAVTPNRAIQNINADPNQVNPTTATEITETHGKKESPVKPTNSIKITPVSIRNPYTAKNKFQETAVNPPQPSLTVTNKKPAPSVTKHTPQNKQTAKSANLNIHQIGTPKTASSDKQTNRALKERDIAHRNILPSLKLEKLHSSPYIDQSLKLSEVSLILAPDLEPLCSLVLLQHKAFSQSIKDLGGVNLTLTSIIYKKSKILISSNLIIKHHEAYA